MSVKFLVCIDRLDKRDDWVWAVRWGNTWALARRVTIRVPVRTVFKGRRARQPRAYLAGIGTTFTQRGGQVTIR
jgi:hypothetical protein